MARIGMGLMAATALTLGISAPGGAASLVGLMEGNRLAWIEGEHWGVRKVVKVAGLTSPIVGIDMRPSDGMLYALTADGSLATIDVAGSTMTRKGKLKAMLPTGAQISVDFNPMADRLRIIGSDGTNLRTNVDDSSVTTDKPLAFATTDMHAGETPMVVAAAYTNSMAGATATALYDIDATIPALLKQAPPNDGVLNAVGKLKLPSEMVAFDIQSDGMGGNSAWLVTGMDLHEVDLGTGATTRVGSIAGLEMPLIDIAVMPEERDRMASAR